MSGVAGETSLSCETTVTVSVGAGETSLSCETVVPVSD